MKSEIVKLLTEYNDIFRHDHCGYWLFGLKRYENGWLAATNETVDEVGAEYLIDLYEDGKAVPADCVFIDDNIAGQVESQLSGDWDVIELDRVIQKVLLDEVVYG